MRQDLRRLQVDPLALERLLQSRAASEGTQPPPPQDATLDEAVARMTTAARAAGLMRLVMSAAVSAFTHMTRAPVTDMTTRRRRLAIFVPLRLHRLLSECRGTCPLRRGRGGASWSLVLGDIAAERPFRAVFGIRPLPRTEAAAFERDVVRGVDEPVECAFREHWVVEERVPLRRRTVRGHDRRAAAYPLAHEFVQVLDLALAERAQ